MHRVAVVATEGVVPFDLSVPVEVFGRARLRSGKPAYVVHVCAAKPTVETDAFALRIRHGLDTLRRADTIVVPGRGDVVRPTPKPVLDALRTAARRGARIASICSGAFILAEAGLLDGRKATTHWVGTDELARRHPSVRVDPNVLYVEDGNVFTSAGAAAGLDLCLRLVRKDCGASVAGEAARMSVMPLERAGGQSQFIRHAPPDEAGTLEPLLRWLEANPDQPVRAIAKRAAMSVRTLNRRFHEQTGTTPLKWVNRARVRKAQALLETSRLSIDEIAARAGFGSAALLREHFRREVATSPQHYRAAFRTP